MKPERLHTRYLIIILTLIIFVPRVYPQGTDLLSSEQKHFYFEFSLSPTKTSIRNNGAFSNSKLDLSPKNSFTGSIEAGYLIGNYFSFSTGLGISSYASNVSLGAYTVSYDTTDSDTPKENYLRTITAKDITELQKILFLDIPLLINFHFPLGDKLGVYLSSGVSLSFPMKKSFNSTGNFTYEGYYSKYNLHITGVDYEGFKKDYFNSEAGGLMVKSFNVGLLASGGIDFNLSGNMQLSFGVTYNRFLSDISGYKTTDKFILSSVPDQMRSIMEGSTSTTVSSIGLRLALRYYLK